MAKTSKWARGPVNTEVVKLVNHIVDTTARLQVIHTQTRVIHALKMAKSIKVINKRKVDARKRGETRSATNARRRRENAKK